MRLDFRRLFVLTAVVMLLAAPLLAWSAAKGIGEMRNEPVLWIPARSVHRQQFDWFRSTFRIRNVVVVSWPGCTVDDVRLKRFEEAMTAPSGSDQDRRLEASFESVSTGYSALRQMMREPLELSRLESLRRLHGVLVGDDGQTSCGVVTFSEYGVEHSDQSLELIAAKLREEVGISPEEAYLAGPPVEGVTIDRLSARAMKFYLVPSALLVLFLARLCLRQWRLTLVLIVVAGFGELLVLSLVWLTGATMNAVLIVMAPLVFVLTVSAGVHLVNYYRDEVRLRGPDRAVPRALRAAWVPCVLAAVTTAIGLVSLTVSEMGPVREFGALAAVGVLTTTGLLFLLLPEPMRRWSPLTKQESRPAQASGERREGRFGWTRLGGWIARHASLVSLVSLVLLIGVGAGLRQIRTSVNVLSLLGPDSPTAADYRWLENQIAPMVPIEVVIRTDARPNVGWLDQVLMLREIHEQIESVERLGGAMSLASFVPELPRGRGLRATLRRTYVRESIESGLDQFQENRYLYRSDDVQALRVTTRAPATADVDYGVVLDKLRERVSPVLERYGQKHGIEVDAIYTGITPLVHVAQQTLLDDLIRSFGVALALVAVVIILVLRNVFAGLVAMLPNLFPAVVLFGGMGWLQIPVDIGTMMTASVALGIAIDGTLHFLIWFRRETSRGVLPRDAVVRTYRHCGTAMWQTAVICGLGLLVFALSEFIPTRRFAWMMLMLLLLAVIADLILLPALLLGPVRRFFVREAPGRDAMTRRVETHS